MKSRTEALTEEQMKTINGGDGIVAFDPVTGKPFEEETGGYPRHPSNDQNGDVFSSQDQGRGENFVSAGM